MNEEIVIEKMDTLAEFYCQKDAIELRKRELLDDVKIPADVEAVVKNGMAAIAAVDSEFSGLFDEINARSEEQLSKIVVPDEIKDALALIDASRRLVNENAALRRAEAQKKIQERKAELQAEIEVKTRAVYDAIAVRKAEIEAEFSDAEIAVDDNIRKLEAEIKADVVAVGYSVKSSHYNAVYTPGKPSYSEKPKQGYSEVTMYRKFGDPFVTLRKV